MKILSLLGLLLAVAILIWPPSGFWNSKLEKAVEEYLLSQNNFSQKTQADGKNYCAIENLNSGNESFPLYIWALCEEFVLENGELAEASGFSGPVKINYSGPASSYDQSKFSFEAPRDGNLHSEDIEKIFPVQVRIKLYAHDNDYLNKEVESMAKKDFQK